MQQQQHLKEKQYQLENNHKRLQKNMVEVQMQHEAISGQYQDELRLRPETLNKLSSTREICDDLEEYSERLKASVSRCKNDQVTLADAYNNVREIKDKQIQSEEKNLQIINNLQEKVKLLAEHKEQMNQVFITPQQYLGAELNDARSKLATALGQKDLLFEALNDLSRKLYHTKRELEKKDENIISLQADMKICILECENEIKKIKNAYSKQEKVIKECTVTNESLLIALQNQEQFTQSICDHNNKLQEKISILEEEQISSSGKITDLENKLEESKSECGKLMRNIEVHKKKAEELNIEIDEKKVHLEHSLIEQQNLKDQILALAKQKSEITVKFNNVTQELTLISVKVEIMSSAIQELHATISEMGTTMENIKVDYGNKIDEKCIILETKLELIEENVKELDTKASFIDQLMSDMSDLQNADNALTTLVNNIEKMKKNIETDKNFAKEKENALTKKVEQLESAAKEREIELFKQMSIILETRKEKDRLRNELKSIQSTIENSEKEMTGRSASLPPRQAAELDDNAAMKRPVPIPINKPVQINRHFDAMSRGERVSPLSFKRRAAVAVAPGAFDEVICLSQLKQAKTKRSLIITKRPDNEAKKSKPED